MLPPSNRHTSSSRSKPTWSAQHRPLRSCRRRTRSSSLYRHWPPFPRPPPPPTTWRPASSRRHPRPAVRRRRVPDRRRPRLRQWRRRERATLRALSSTTARSSMRWRICPMWSRVPWRTRRIAKIVDRHRKDKSRYVILYIVQLLLHDGNRLVLRHTLTWNAMLISLRVLIV